MQSPKWMADGAISSATKVGLAAYSLQSLMVEVWILNAVEQTVECEWRVYQFIAPDLFFAKGFALSLSVPGSDGV